MKIKGVTTIDKFDGELTIGSVTGIKKIGDFTVSREDLSPVKRVELHCHTKMSDMDGVSEVKSIVKELMTGGIRRSRLLITELPSRSRMPIIISRRWIRMIRLK